MLYVCVQKFDVTDTAQTFLTTKRGLNASIGVGAHGSSLPGQLSSPRSHSHPERGTPFRERGRNTFSFPYCKSSSHTLFLILRSSFFDPSFQKLRRLCRSSGRFNTKVQRGGDPFQCEGSVRLRCSRTCDRGRGRELAMMNQNSDILTEIRHHISSLMRVPSLRAHALSVRIGWVGSLVGSGY